MLVDLGLFRDAVVLKFEIKIFFAENIDQPFRISQRFLRVPRVSVVIKSN